MTVYVDDLIEIKGEPYKVARMAADSEAELHAFASQIGVPISALRSYPFLHYSMRSKKRHIAVLMGALQVSCEELVKRARGKP